MSTWALVETARKKQSRSRGGAADRILARTFPAAPMARSKSVAMHSCGPDASKPKQPMNQA
eukprot:7907180-Pyramimonas_sp.AAC.1